MRNERRQFSFLRRRSFLSGALLALLPYRSARAQAPEVKAEQYFKSEQMQAAVMSPDGLRLALLTLGTQGRIVLSVLEFASMKLTIIFSSDMADVGEVVWVNPLRLAFTLAQKETPEGERDAAPGLFAIDHDGNNYKQLVEQTHSWVKDGNDTRRMEPWNTFLLNSNSLREGADVLVVRPEAYSDKDWGYCKLLRLNTKNARSQEVYSPAHSVAWWPDAQGELRVVLTREGKQGALRWKDPTTDQWRVLSEFNVFVDGGGFQVRGIAPDGRLYVSAQRGADKLAMWLLDPQTGAWSDKPLAHSPGFDVDAQVIARKDKVLGLRFSIDAEVTQWLDPEMQTLQQVMDKLLPRTVNRLSVPWSGEQSWVLVEAFADIQPKLFYLYNRQTRKFIRLGAQRPDIDAKKMASMDLQRCKARDGQEIPVWITLPPGSDGKTAHPTVVLVHGGPFSHGPEWRWDAQVQFLAARGFAVLQPQFRGTLGFGAKHFRGGWRQWGKAMQDDVSDATQWAISQGIADPKRIAIAGGSYGGYASLMGLIRQPELYRCAIAWVAVTDLDMLYTVNWSDSSDDYKLHGMPSLVGDRVKDADDLKENSPLTHAGKINKPLLLAYGSADRRVPLIHGEAFRRALPAEQRNLEWIVYDKEGHGWRKTSNQMDFWSRAANFLDQHLAP